MFFDMKNFAKKQKAKQNRAKKTMYGRFSIW